MLPAFPRTDATPPPPPPDPASSGCSPPPSAAHEVKPSTAWPSCARPCASAGPVRDLHTADGGKRSGDTTTLLSHRYYLTDAAFTMAITGQPDHPAHTTLLKHCTAALRRPRWPLFLRRRACPPTGPHILLQSGHQPDPIRLPHTYGQTTTRTIDTMFDAIRPSQQVHFRCVASPVCKPGATTRALYNLPAVVPLTGQHADEWWFRQDDTAGLKVLTLHS
ncbi:type I-E CRISPR-associated protein Cas6/Cse3/CasE [Streptomyces sp. NPDC019396]|uniref:type I-E CRISPR-associated protein Cas6/Cse3/CasE n=1 Tax=Streptomyces sp. NPDC019396 TaxID=3154687 RepID=UPI0033FC2849